MLNVSIVVENVGDVLEHGSLVSFVFVLITHIKRLNKVLFISQSTIGFEGLFKRFGRHIKVVKPGLHYVNPCTDTLSKIDNRITVLDLDR